MIPRGRLDITRADLVFAASAGARRWKRHTLRWDLEGLMGPRDEFLACLSVRSGFDLLLEALALPKGSEILLSAVTIRDMPRIIRAHGLVPVPVDLDMDTLSMDPWALQRAISPWSRMILAAHLFGSRMPLEGIADVARRNDLLLVEDCAQAFVGRGFAGAPESDVVMFSFGPIKTHTCLGGALVRVRSPELMDALRRIERRRPLQPAGEYTERALKYLGIHGILAKPAYSTLAVAFNLTRSDHDRIVSAAFRGFSGPGFFPRIRRRPSTPLLATMLHRLTGISADLTRTRTARAEQFLSGIPELTVPGRGAEQHTHWVVPVEVDEPGIRRRELWRHGFDATQGATSIAAIPAPDARPETIPSRAIEALRRVLFLPVHSGASASDLDRLLRIVSRWPAVQREVALHG
jgi:perosamine synthetase